MIRIKSFLADGLCVDIHDTLTKVSGVFPIGMGSAMAYPDKSAKLAASKVAFKTVESNV